MKGVNFLCLLPNLQAALVSRLVSLTLSRHAATAVVTVAVFMRNNTMLDRTLCPLCMHLRRKLCCAHVAKARRESRES